ncbi:MAG: hypothetical protein DRN18_00545 [Thermoplasmata archaeon]|nr:MAG: hypothetical protein DRN18_00545 [Thermoplasmata archaeon]
MVQIAFLDTNVILDYLENRNSEVTYIVRRLIDLYKKGKIVIATSIFNVAELIDKEFEINFFGDLLHKRLSFDEIIRKKHDKKLYRDAAQKYKKDIEKKIQEFLFDNEIKILCLYFATDDEGEKNLETYKELYNLIYEYQFSSQDALIVATALKNGVTYFLSNDDDLVGQLNQKGLLDAYNLRERTQRTSFVDNVLDTISEVLK